jgi:hypothetical protein
MIDVGDDGNVANIVPFRQRPKLFEDQVQVTERRQAVGGQEDVEQNTARRGFEAQKWELIAHVATHWPGFGRIGVGLQMGL